jgi:hypothetical protein
MRDTGSSSSTRRIIFVCIARMYRKNEFDGMLNTSRSKRQTCQGRYERCPQPWLHTSGLNEDIQYRDQCQSVCTFKSQYILGQRSSNKPVYKTSVLRKIRISICNRKLGVKGLLPILKYIVNQRWLSALAGPFLHSSEISKMTNIL